MTEKRRKTEQGADCAGGHQRENQNRSEEMQEDISELFFCSYNLVFKSTKACPAEKAKSLICPLCDLQIIWL